MYSRGYGAYTFIPSLTLNSHWADDRLYSDLLHAFEEGHRILLLVGHETRLSQLILRFTGERRRPLEALEATLIQAEHPRNLWQGSAKIAWRYPIRNWLEAELVEKIRFENDRRNFLS